MVKKILDAGPLVAFLASRDAHHEWACETLEQMEPPFYSCPEVMAEAAAITGRPDVIVEMIEAGEIILKFDLSEHAGAVRALLRKYADRRMDLADACIVRMTETIRNSVVITLDRTDFAVYRRNGRESIPIIAPPSES